MRLNCGEIEELSDLGSLVFEIVDDEQALRKQSPEPELCMNS